jgi:acetylornithine deacetylase/succinyl-diaminopimelate desuccinylase-like protein
MSLTKIVRPSRHAMLVALAVLAGVGGCRAASRTAEPRRPGLDGPSSAPVRELPRRAALITAPGDGDWAEIGREATELLQQYLRINTTNPPGNEMAAARWLETVLRREGIEAEVFQSAQGRANLVARLRGDGSARPLVLLHHMDVVEATREFWSVDPFGGEIRGAHIYGRGAVDMKGHSVAQLMTLLLLRRTNYPLARDIIFLATADEEAGGLAGAGWIARERPELVRGAEFLITEGGSIDADNSGRATGVYLGVGEKAPFWLTVTARGTAGHGSRPNPDNAVERLVRATARLAAYETPLVLVPLVERYFRAIAPRETDARRRAWLENPAAALADSAGRAWLLSIPHFESLLRNTIAVTMLSGSGKVNVIPPIARAEVDVRLLPGQDPQAVLRELRAVVNDPRVSIEPQGIGWEATESPFSGALVAAVEEVTRRHFGGLALTSTMLAGFTDSHWFRRMGIASYGLGVFAEAAEDQGRLHGNDERLALAAIGPGVRYLYDIVTALAGRR